ncbi:putative agmatinase 1 [Cyphellophora attinorum]|uniref:Putative agmatinase 1 n=1 Tax=Cyphellophora attinorum TaxID=1664694 RepID=A0A0N1HT05_9EURO|nr:putative agmatinase 1 [Phialophora attinorum]KPI41943.1 putative agmatinase 1 [Phialophora attinorum]
MCRRAVLCLALAGACLARELIFPDSLQIRPDDQVVLASEGFEGDQKFAGLTTFANLPWQHCLSTSDEQYDIAFLGAPFDTATTGRPGARFGPTGIRLGSRRLHASAGWSAYTHENAFQSWAKVIDCGDAPLTFLDNTAALKQLVSAHKQVSGKHTNASDIDSPSLGPVNVIHFDSHIDTWDPKVLGGGISHYAGVNHGTFLHIAVEEGLVLNNSIHAGIRAPAVNKKYDWKHDKACGFEIVTARDIDRMGISGIIQKLKSRVGDSNVYITVDIDVLDPAYAPATGTAEVGGWTTRELLSILDGLEGLKVIGADIVEVAPVYDNAGETTVLAAAEVAHSLMTLMVQTPVKASRDAD